LNEELEEELKTVQEEILPAKMEAIRAAKKQKYSMAHPH
jgi:hypothetical protein